MDVPLVSWVRAGALTETSDPYSVGDAEDATIRRLANHTAGLPLHYRFYYEDENGVQYCEHQHPIEGNPTLSVTTEDGTEWGGITAEVVVAVRQEERP